MTATAGNPTPECCGEPMYWNPDPRVTQGGVWVCRERKRTKNRGYYAEMSGLDYSKLLLRHRRTKALKRMEVRNGS